MVVDNNRLEEQEEELLLDFDEFQLVSDMRSQSNPAVVMNDKGFVITWTSFFWYSDNSNIYAKQYDLDGNPLGDSFIVNSDTQGPQEKPAIAINGNGFVITWETFIDDERETDIVAQRFDLNGNPLGNEFLVNTYTYGDQIRPDIAMNDEGFIITWDSYGQDGSRYGIYAQR